MAAHAAAQQQAGCSFPRLGSPELQKLQFVANHPRMFFEQKQHMLLSSQHHPVHFSKGSMIQLADGELKRVEELRTEDFVHSSDICPRLNIDSSRLVHMRQNHDNGTAILAFEVGKQLMQVGIIFIILYVMIFVCDVMFYM